MKVGCSASLAVALVWVIKGLALEFEVNPFQILPTGSDVSGASSSGAATSFPKMGWERGLDLADNHLAPECLRDRLKELLRYLVNIGRKRTLPENQFLEFIEPLSLIKE